MKKWVIRYKYNPLGPLDGTIEVEATTRGAAINAAVATGRCVRTEIWDVTDE